MQTMDFTTVARERDIYRQIDEMAAVAAGEALGRAAAGDDGLLAASWENDENLINAVGSPELNVVLPKWMREMREIASLFPDSGACTIATAFKLWQVTAAEMGDDHADELGEILVPLIAARCLVLESLTDTAKQDLAHVYAARIAAGAGAQCAELVFGYRKHLTWDKAGCATCFAADDLDDLEAIMPGIASGARTTVDIIEANGSHPAKRGPCASSNGLELFMRLRHRLDVCLTGARIARDGIAKRLVS